MHPGTSRSLVLTAVQLLAALLAVLVLREVLPGGVEGAEFLAVLAMVVVLMGINYVYWAIRDGWWLPSIALESDPDERREAIRERLADRRSGASGRTNGGDPAGERRGSGDAGGSDGPDRAGGPLPSDDPSPPEDSSEDPSPPGDHDRAGGRSSTSRK